MMGMILESKITMATLIDKGCQSGIFVERGRFSRTAVKLAELQLPPVYWKEAQLAGYLYVNKIDS